MDVSWPQILLVTWLTAAVCGGVLLLALAHDAAVLCAARRARLLRRQSAAKHLEPHARLGRAEPCRLRLARALHPSTSSAGRAIEFAAVLAGLAEYVLYIVLTYSDKTSATAIAFIALFTAFFVARLLLRLVATEPGQRFSFLFHLDRVVDVACCTQAALVGLSTSFSFTFLRPVNAFFAWRALDSRVGPALVGPALTRVQRLLIGIGLMVFAFLAAFAGTVSALESAGNPPGWGQAVESPGGGVDGFTAFNSLYFALISMATVGYGDLLAVTLLGRLTTMLYIVTGIVLTGWIISSIIALLSQRVEGAGRVANAASRPLVLLTGECSVGQLEEILQELFPPHARASGARLHAVLLLDGENFRDELPSYFEAHPDLAARVTVLSGSVLDRAALVRAAAHTPEMQAAVVLQKRFARDDTHNLLRVLALRRALPLLPLFVMLGDSRNLPVALAAGVNEDGVLLSDMLRHGLLAANVVTPGAAPLLINLFSSDPLEPPQSVRPGSWEFEYWRGLGQTIREVRCPAWLLGRTLIDATVLVFFARLILKLSREAAAAEQGQRPATAAAAASAAAAADVLRFADVEELMRHLASRFEAEKCEGPVLVAVRHAHHAHHAARQHVRARAAGGARGAFDGGGSRSGGDGGGNDGPSAVHCDLQSARRLALGDTLFVIGRDLSVLSHDVAASGRELLRAPLRDAEGGGGDADEGGPAPSGSDGARGAIRSIWRHVASGLGIEPLGSAGNGSGSDNAISPRGAVRAAPPPAPVLPQPPLRGIAPSTTPPPSPDPSLSGSSLRVPAAPVAPVARSISFFEPAQHASAPDPALPAQQQQQLQQQQQQHARQPEAGLLRAQLRAPPPAPREEEVKEEAPAPTTAPASSPARGQARDGRRIGRERESGGSGDRVRRRRPSPLPAELGPPPPGLRDHVVIITDAWLDSLPLFLRPLRQVSSRPVVVLTPAAPPSAEWLRALHAAVAAPRPANANAPAAARFSPPTPTPTAISPTSSDDGGGGGGARMRRSRSGGAPAGTEPDAGAGAAGGLYYVRGSPLVEADTRRARLQYARRAVIVTAEPPRPPQAGAAAAFTSLPHHDIYEKAMPIGAPGMARARSGAHETPHLGEVGMQVDAVAVLATMFIEQKLAGRSPALLYGTSTEIARNCSVQLLSSATELGEVPAGSPPPRRRPGRLEAASLSVLPEPPAQQHQQRVPPAAAAASVASALASVSRLRIRLPRVLEAAPVPSPEEAPLPLRRSSVSMRTLPAVAAAAAAAAAESLPPPPPPAPPPPVPAPPPVAAALPPLPRSRLENASESTRSSRSSLSSSSSSSLSPRTAESGATEGGRDVDEALAPGPEAARLRAARQRRAPGAALAMAMSPMAAPGVRGGSPGGTRRMPRPEPEIEPAPTVDIDAGEVEADAPPQNAATPAAPVAGAHGWSGQTEPPQLRWSARYAAGRLVPTSFINNLIVASLRNPSLLRLVSMFARGTEIRLRHVQIPPELLVNGGALFAQVFLTMALRHRVVVVGVFRSSRHLQSPLPYVMTNPPMNAKVRAGDVLFVVVAVGSRR